MNAAFRFADDLGPSRVILIHEPTCALADEQDNIFGPDMDTDEQCMAWIKDEIGATGWGVF